jgi:hypothetical protein
MAKIDWMIKGPWLTTCSCVVGLPVSIQRVALAWPLPCRRRCEIEEGHFGKVRLDGVRFAGMFRLAGAIHFGNGEAQPIIDQSATQPQRDAILTIMKGEETEPGATIFNVFAGTFVKVHATAVLADRVFRRYRRARGRIHVAGVLDVTSEPIRNPVTGATHRVRLDTAERLRVLASRGRASNDAHWQGRGDSARLARRARHYTQVHFTRQGVVR